MLSKGTLPSALVGSDNFKQLSPEQIASFEKRIAVIDDLAGLIRRRLDGDVADATFSEFLDDLELDVAAYQALDATHGNVTPWLTHSSWSFDTTTEKMRNAVESSLFNYLDTPNPTMDATVRDIEMWLGKMAEGIQISLNGFAAADTYDAALAHLFCIDILFAHLFAGLYKTRLLVVVESSGE